MRSANFVAEDPLRRHDARLVVQRQRVITAAPAVADPRFSVDDERIDAEQRQPRGNGEPRLRRAHHQHGRVTVA